MNEPRKKTHLIYMDDDGHAWVGENLVGKNPINASFYSEIPDNDNSNWKIGKPSENNIEFLTLSPFYPSGRLDVSIEIKRTPELINPNHPPFYGCVKYMELPYLDLKVINKHISRAIYTIGLCHYGKKEAFKTIDIEEDAKDKAMRKGFEILKPKTIEHLICVGVNPNSKYDEYFNKKPKFK